MIDSLAVSSLRDGVSTELLAVFRDDMMQVRRLPAEAYKGYGGIDDDEYIESRFRAPARVIADRLDVLGIDADTVREILTENLQTAGHSDIALSSAGDDLRAELERSNALLRSLDADAWIAAFQAVQDEDAEITDRFLTGSKSWLLGQLDYWDERYALRMLLLALPDAAEVVLDITDMTDEGWTDGYSSDLASDALDSMRAVAAGHAPMVVLTEGRTDSEFLSLALGILYPHLTDLIRFLDFEQKPEGGAGALVRLVKAFAAAGIANNVVALFDNDAAAVDAMRTLDLSKLPANIRAMRYPDTELAADYPTLGPPTANAPGGTASRANVNGLAASIELYLGRDVLAAASGGELRPVHWRSYLQGPASYQGEVTGKGEIHEAFRAKCEVAGENVLDQDWEGLTAILSMLISAFGS